MVSMDRAIGVLDQVITRDEFSQVVNIRIDGRWFSFGKVKLGGLRWKHFEICEGVNLLAMEWLLQTRPRV